MALAYCVTGIGLLILSIILCAVRDDYLWLFVQIAGEIIAFMGYAPVLLKLFSQ
ncbi:unknown [Clostridium sp. CAG:299]|jgi:hypothetical protein|nr:unknown [Clostridium sp. CAG:299]DAV29279.1 MAG TPA: hypothetical protein [Bacteriophage sp.]